MNKKYTQFLLSNKNEEGFKLQETSFIPSKFAVVGQVLKIKDANNNWVDGWVVELVGATLEEDKLPDYRKCIREHRKSTGDSLRK